MEDIQQQPTNQQQAYQQQQKISPFLDRPIILGDLTLASPTTQTTVGAAGGATAQPATPLGYLLVQVGTTTVAVPYHSQS